MVADSNRTRRKFLKYSGIAGVTALAGCMGSTNEQNETTTEGQDQTTTASSDGSSTETVEGDISSVDWRPERNVRLIVPWGAGGGTDTAVRQVAQPAQDILSEEGINVELNVENITGASGVNAAQTVLNQPADGHTIFADTNVIAPNLAQGTDRFTFDDWAGIARIQYDTTFIFSSARDGNGYEDINALVETAKQDGIQFGISGGLASAVFPVQFAQEAGFVDNLEIVPYDDAGRMENDVITGEIDTAYGELVELEGLLEEGDIQLLYAGIDKEVRNYEDIPNINDTGWDAPFGTQRAFVAQSGTPQDAIDFWMQLTKQAMQTDSYQQFEQENYLDLRDGFLAGPQHMENLQELVGDFESAMEVYQG